MNQLYTSGWRALEELRDQGVIKGIGAGFNTIGTIPRYLDMFDIDFFLIAMRYTLLEQDVLDLEFPRCAERGVGIVIGGTYNSGITATGVGAEGDVQLRARRAGDSGARAENGGGLQAPRRAARRGGAAVPARPSDRRLGHSRRHLPRAGRA